MCVCVCVCDVCVYVSMCVRAVLFVCRSKIQNYDNFVWGDAKIMQIVDICMNISTQFNVHVHPRTGH